MTDLRTAAQQALEALEQCGLDDTRRNYALESAAITALRAALAEPVQEPLTDEELDKVISFHWNNNTVKKILVGNTPSKDFKTMLVNICRTVECMHEIGDQCPQCGKKIWRGSLHTCTPK